LHIIDDTVCYQKKDKVFLVGLGYSFAFSHINNRFDNRGKVCWTIEIDVIDSMLVGFNYSLKTINFRIENIAIQSKTMACSVVDWRNLSAKTKSRDIFVRIIVLKN